MDSLFQIAKLLGLSIQKEAVISKFQQDSRLVGPGDLFFALEGEKADGHAFLQEVANKKAVAAVVSKKYQGPDYGLQLLAVDKVLDALHLIARKKVEDSSFQIIGVTGSVGKTTTKEFIATLLEKKFSVAKTEGNANSQVGMPLSILNARKDLEVFVIEMGMSQPLEIKSLISIAPPDIALVTKVALAHAAFFPDGLESIARAKGEIFSHRKTRFGISHAQAMQYDGIAKEGSCLKISYGWKEEYPHADYQLEKVGAHYRIMEGQVPSPLFTLPFDATHLSENFLGAAVICRKMGLFWEEIFERAQHLTTYKNRFEKISQDGILFFNDSYNASEASILAALSNLPKPSQGGKTIAVLGSMRELGPFSEECHLRVAKAAIGAVDHLICIGSESQPMVDYFSKNQKEVRLFSSLSEIKAHLFELAKPGDVVLLKGANSHKLWKLLEKAV